MPAQEYEVQAVMETVTKAGNPLWHVVYMKPDGTYHDHYFPQETLEWRAAEYDIDPEDVDTLLDIVLHEPFKAPVNRDDPALKQGRVSPAVMPSAGTRVGELEATNLFNAETKKDAREAHLVRIEHAKKNLVKVVTPKGAKDPLEKIRNQHRNRDNRVEERRSLVNARRAQLAQIREEAELQNRKKV